jgi:hypothetical protein
MSLYYVQKFLYEINRSETVRDQYFADRTGSLASYDLTDEEVRALVEPDIGMLFHMGVNGQILMHFAPLHGIEWSDYLRLMREGIAEHGPVRAGVYAITGYEGVDNHADNLGQQSHAIDGVPSTTSATEES